MIDTSCTLARTAVAVSLVSGLSLPAWAEEGGFFEDAKAGLTLRNYYFNRDFRDSGAAKSKVDEWAQGFILKFTSGYTPGLVGVGLDGIALFGMKLDSSRDASGSELLPVHDDGRAADNYGRAGLAAKLRISATELKVGELIDLTRAYYPQPRSVADLVALAVLRRRRRGERERAQRERAGEDQFAEGVGGHGGHAAGRPLLARRACCLTWATSSVSAASKVLIPPHVPMGGIFQFMPVHLLFLQGIDILHHHARQLTLGIALACNHQIETLCQLALAIPGPLGKQQGVGRKGVHLGSPSSVTVTHSSTGNHPIQITASSAVLIQMPQGKCTAPMAAPAT